LTAMHYTSVISFRLDEFYFEKCNLAAANNDVDATV
jgi:hypothetical protein